MPSSLESGLRRKVLVEQLLIASVFAANYNALTGQLLMKADIDLFSQVRDCQLLFSEKRYILKIDWHFWRNNNFINE